MNKEGGDRMHRVKIVFILSAIVALSACAHYRVDPKTAMKPMSPSAPAVFAYSAKAQPPRFEFLEERQDYTIYKVHIRVKDFPEIKKEHLRFWYFVPKNPKGDMPVSIILPPTGGDYDSMTGFGRYFAEHGFVSLVFQRRNRYFDTRQDLNYNKRLIEQSAIDVRRAIDFLQTQPNVDMSRIGLTGVSLGGIISALATAADDRIRTLVMVIAAGDLPDLVATTGYSNLIRFRKKMLFYKHLTLAELPVKGHELLDEIDPLTYADRLPPSRVMMMNGRCDNIVKFRVAKTTWEKLGRPEWRIMPSTHYGTFLLSRFIKDRIRERLARDFGMDS